MRGNPGFIRSDTSERNAERVAKLLEQNKPVSCNGKGDALR